MPAFTRDWDSGNPPGSRSAKQIDDSIREFRVDVYDRLVTLLDDPADIDVSPLKLMDDITGKLTGRIDVYPPGPLLPDTGVEITNQLGPLLLNTPGGIPATVKCWRHFRIPVGYELTLVEMRASRGSNTNVTMRPYIVNYNTGSPSALATLVTRTASGIGTLASAAFSHTFTALEYLSVEITTLGVLNAEIYGFRLVINRANNSLSA